MTNPNKIIGNILGNRKLKIDTRSRNNKKLPNRAKHYGPFKSQSTHSFDLWTAESPRGDIYIAYLDQTYLDEFANFDYGTQKSRDELKRNKGKYKVEMHDSKSNRDIIFFGTKSQVFAKGMELYHNAGGK